jgi:hypothetical protein
VAITRLPALALVALLGAAPLAAQLTPLAIYPLQTDLLDSTQTWGPITLFGTPPPNAPANGICLSGVYYFSAPPGGQDFRTPILSTLNTNDFEFSFEFSITSLGPFNRPVVMGGHLWRFLGLYVQPNGIVGIKHNNSNLAWSTTTVSIDTWYSATVKYENGTAEVYINGDQVMSVPVGVLSTSTNLNFCTNDYSNGTAFHGCVRNLVIANDTTLGISAGAFPYGTGCDGLTLGSNGAPTIGNLTFEVIVGNVPVVSPIVFVAFGTAATIPGIDLAVIGMPGCLSYTSLDLGLFGPVVVIGGSANLPLPIPPVPSLAGAVLTSQGLSFSAATPAGLASSNGLQLVIAPCASPRSRARATSTPHGCATAFGA